MPPSIQAGKQSGGILDVQFRLAEFPFFGLFHLAAQLLNHQLGAVADAEHRNAQLENGRIGMGSAVVVDRTRAAGQDDAGGCSSLSFSREMENG